MKNEITKGLLKFGISILYIFSKFGIRRFEIALLRELVTGNEATFKMLFIQNQFPRRCTF
jgi:hypothetical protein